jgi:cupin 2 domain-containing protein
MNTGNLYNLPGGAVPWEPEFLETICSGKQVRIERIISSGHITAEESWYDQKLNEWVLLLRGKASLEFENGRVVHLSEGDHLMIPAGKKHRVAYTSKKPECIWLAVHFE